MGYPAHYLLQFGGPRGGSNQEIWTCGIRMVAVGGLLDSGETQDYLDDVCVVALRGWFLRDGSRIANTAKLGFAKLNQIGSDGRYVNPLTIENYLPVPLAGSNSPLPSASVMQVSLAITWETDTVSRGLAAKGRIYSPAPCVSVSTDDGLFPAAQALGVAESAAQLVSDLRGPGGAGSMVPNIVSDRLAGVAHRIDRVSVDNRCDIIRKRGSSQSPVRSTIAVPA